MLSNSLIGSASASAQLAKFDQSQVAAIWRDQKFRSQLNDVLRSDAAQRISTERAAGGRDLQSASRRQSVAWLKRLPGSSHGADATSATLENIKTGVKVGTRSTPRLRQADQKKDKPDESMQEVSAADKKASSRNDDFLPPKTAAEKSEKPREEDDTNKNDATISSGSDRSQSDDSQPTGSTGDAKQGELTIEPAIIQEGVATSIAANEVTSLKKDSPKTLAENTDEAAQLNQALLPEKNGVESSEVNAAITTEPPSVMPASERSVILSKLKGTDAEGSPELPVAFTLNFEPASAQLADSQVLHLRNHLPWNNVSNQDREAANSFQTTQLHNAPDPHQAITLNVAATSLDALMRLAVQAEERDGDTLALDTNRMARSPGGEAVGFCFTLAPAMGPPLGRSSEFNSHQLVEKTGAVNEVEPAVKRPVSQLILRLGSETDTSIAVRLNSHGLRLRMDVLGGDQELRNSLRGSLSHLEMALERQGLDSGWKAIGGAPQGESRLQMNDAASTSPFDSDPNQHNGNRSGHDGTHSHGGNQKDNGSPKNGGGFGNQRDLGGRGELFSLGTSRSSDS